ncbi:hypothetical protein M3Y98_00752400 [Aphelenchoides besseyi]|nr:hypothetical protein M3Y98_00752400 [Aphelenchoides besseyi]
MTVANSVERPPDSVVNLFYRLADFSSEERVAAAVELLNCEGISTQYKDYVLDRLIRGLATGKTACRFGFSTALGGFLQTYPDTLDVDEFLKLVEEKLPLNLQKSENVGNGIGQHLAFLSAYESAAFDSQLRKLVIRHVTLLSDSPFLSLAVVNAISDAAKRFDASEFKKQILPQIRSLIEQPLSTITLHGLILLIDLAPVFPKLLRSVNSAVTSEGLEIKDKDHESIISLLKSADPSHRHAICVKILRLGADNHKFTTLLSGIVNKYVWEGDEAKSCARYFDLMANLFAETKFGNDQVLQLFDTKFVVSCRKYAHRSDPSFRGMDAAIAEAIDEAKKRIESQDFESNDLYNFLEMIDGVEGGDFDTRVALPFRFTEFLISKLNNDDYIRFAQRAFRQDHWSYKRLVVDFAQRPSGVKKSVLSSLGKKDEKTFTVACGLLEQIFKVHYKFNRFAEVELKATDAEMLLELCPAKKSTKNKKSDNSLEILAAGLRYLGRVASDEQDAEQYSNEADELVKISRKPTGQSTALMDLLISVISRTHRVHRPLAFFGITKNHSLFKPKDVEHLVEGICRSDSEILDDGEDMMDEDDEFKPITEEERRAIQEKWAKKADDVEMKEEAEETDDSTDADSEVDVGDDEEEGLDPTAPVDPLFVARIKNALGKAAFEEEDQSDTDIEMDDEEMEELDKNLASALRTFTTRGKKEQTENVKVFRSKCIEILNVYFTVATLEEAQANIHHLTSLVSFLQRHQFTELLKKTSAICTAIANKHKTLKPQFQRRGELLLPKVEPEEK